MTNFFKIHKWTFVKIVQLWLSVLGFLMIVRKLDGFPEPSLSCFGTIAVALTLILVLIDGFCFRGYFRNSIEITCNTGKIIIKFGDIFKQDGWKVIGVNDYFDSQVDDIVVAKSSLHGQMLCNIWGGNTADWDAQIEKELEGNPSKNSNMRKGKKGKNERYSLGTTAKVTYEDKKFLCVALATSNNDYVTETTMYNLYNSIQQCLEKAIQICSNTPLSLPLLGGGLAKVGFSNEPLLNFIITAIQEQSKKTVITKEIFIILPKDKKYIISLYNIKKMWS